MREKYKIKKYELKFTGTTKMNVSFTLTTNDNEITTKKENGNIIYVVLNNEVVLYVGEAKTDIKTRLARGFATYRSFNRGIKPRDGYKGYKWIELFEQRVKKLEIVVVLLEILSSDKENKEFRESIEGELCWLVREKEEWPTYKNEIHFHNGGGAKKIAKNIFIKIMSNSGKI